MNQKQILIAIGLVLLGTCIGYALRGVQEPKIVSIPQHQAESKEGVKQAASKAGVELNDGQAAEIAKEVPNAKKEYTVATTMKDLPKTAESERNKAQADFSMITDPNNPDESFDLSKYDKNTAVELNQYNIKAYKKRLWGVNYYPRNLHDLKPAMISVDHSIKISKSGKYLGASVAHNLDNHRTYFGVRYEF